MKRRILLTVLIAIILFTVTIFSSCSTIKTVVKRIDKIPVNGDYTFVSNNAITHKGKDYGIEKLIKSALISKRQNVFDPTSPSIITYNKGKLFFEYNYYNKMLSRHGEDYSRKFCSGYVDINNLSVHLFGLYQHEIPYFSSGLNGYRVGKVVVYINGDGLVEIYDAETAEKRGEIAADYLKKSEYESQSCISDCEEVVFYEPENGKMLLIDGDGVFKEITIDFGQSLIKFLYGFTADYMLFYKSGLSGPRVVAYDRQTYSIADEETAQAVLEEIDNYNSSAKVEYGGETYNYSVFDGEIVFESQSGELTTVTMTALRESSKELRKIEEICGGELAFQQVKAANGELYIIVKNDDFFFGTTMFSHVTPPIVFKYDMNGSFEYIGRSSGAYVKTIIKN